MADYCPLGNNFPTTPYAPKGYKIHFVYRFLSTGLIIFCSTIAKRSPAYGDI